MDLHLHTLASHDYEQPDKSYLDILRQAEARGLDIIAFTDHNTVNGFRNLMREVEQLEWLEQHDRIRADEQGRLNEYRRLLEKILVLPGFEFTATFGFHIIGIFSPKKPVREIEHILLELRVPSRVIDEGHTEAGATSDVLTAYRLIDEAGGIAIAAHANSSNGVSMRDLNLGGQTRIAFTQDPHLHAIEITDLDKGRYSSGRLFTGIRAEYPRHMHLLQGSDAHRVVADPKTSKRLGIGDRVTEVQLDTVSFEALQALLKSQEFGRVRPTFSAYVAPANGVHSAREAGEGPTRAFHPQVPKRGDRFTAILQDVCAMLSGDGGDIYIGCESNPSKKVGGVPEPAKLSSELADEIAKRIAPSAHVAIETKTIGGASVVLARALRSKDAPHTLDGAFFVRDGATTRAANRDDIVAMTRRAIEHEIADRERHARDAARAQPAQPASEARPDPRQGQGRRHEQQPRQQPQQQQPRQPQPDRNARPADGKPQAQPRAQSQRQAQPQPQKQGPRRDANNAPRTGEAATSSNGTAQPEAAPAATKSAPSVASPAQDEAKAQATAAAASVASVFNGAPRNGVQIASVDTRDGVRYFTVRDLRKNMIVRNVTINSARDLWHYAVTKTAKGDYPADKIEWQGDRAVLSHGERGGKLRYDLAMRNDVGDVQIFFGVTEDGLDENWTALLPRDEARDGAPDVVSQEVPSQGEPSDEVSNAD